jgi:hypothetical protein
MDKSSSLGKNIGGWSLLGLHPDRYRLDGL